MKLNTRTLATTGEDTPEHPPADDMPTMTEPKELPPPDTDPLSAAQAAGEAANAGLKRSTDRREGIEKPIPLPWRSLRAQYGGVGLWPGAHYIIGGTGTGKTQFALQVAHNAAVGDVGHDPVPTLYIALELDAPQIGNRLIAIQDAQRAPDTPLFWSDLENGRLSISEIGRARHARDFIQALDILILEEKAHTFGAKRLEALARAFRKRHPHDKDAQGRARRKPLLMVLDYLQVVGRDDDGPKELRERIAQAAYAARDIARTHHITMLVISSTARMNYATTGGGKDSELAKVGLDVRDIDGGEHLAIIANPDHIIGLGKESGEVEYSADSVTVLARNGEGEGNSTRVLVLTPKLRAGRAQWNALDFDGNTYREANIGDSGLEQIAGMINSDNNRSSKDGQKEASKGSQGSERRGTNRYGK